MAGFGYNIGLDGHSVTPLTEREAEEVAQGIRDVYGMARQEMLEKVARRMGQGLHRPGWAERKAGEILGAHHEMAGILDRAERSRTGFLDGIMDRAYHSGSQKFYSDMGAILGDVRHISPNSMKAGYILADLNNSLDAAHRRILRQFDDKYAAIIGVASAEMSTGVINTREAVGKALQAFADQGITGFIDRGGHHWTLENYSEMAVLTAINRSTIAGYVDTMQSYGYDLAQIDGHYGSCPICEAWEHVIVSVSGQDPRYPSIADAEADGCFHPRCLHSVTTYYEGVSHGEARDRPREIRDASPEYTARSKQRYMERQIRKYKDRAIVAQTPQQKAQAINKVREWENALDSMIAQQPADNYLYRQGYREKSSAGNELLHKQPTHQRISSEGRKVIPEALYNKLIGPVLRSGGIVERGTEFAESHLRSQGAYASHIGGMLFFRKDATISDVIEEVFHYHQERGSDYSQYSGTEQILRMEIDAKKHLISVAERYKIPSEETELTRRELQDYERRLEEWLRSH